MLKKRILCLVLCFSVFVSCSFFKPKDVYAFAPALTVAGVALALASACGLTFYGTSSDIEEQISSFLSANPDQETFITTLISDHSVDGTFINLGKLVLSQYKDSILSFFSSIFSYFNNPGSSDGVIPGDNPFSYLNVPITSDIFSVDSHYITDFYQQKTFPFALSFYRSTYDFYIYFTYFIEVSPGVYSRARYYFNWECPTYDHDYTLFEIISHEELVSSKTFTLVPGVTPCVYGLLEEEPYLISTAFDVASSDKLLISSSRINYLWVPQGFFYDSTVYLDNPNSAIQNATFFSYAMPEMLKYLPYDKMAFKDVSLTDAAYTYVYPEGVTQDDVITGWTNAFEQANEDVIIYPLSPDELVGVNGYDIAYGYEGVAGAVEGVDLPQSGVENPDVPVTPDLSGSTILLNNILSYIKSIPATIIGTGSLNFDAFNNINLSHVFPFCIPFDLISSFQVFNRQPVEPVLTLDFSGTVFEPVGTYTIDLTQFEPLAKIIRFFSYSFFVLGLVLVTRKIIKG